jgi:HSP20 family molecular chaperone IbpA
MKYLAPGITFLALLLGITVSAQEFEKKLTSFDKITVSPKINLILTQGDTESIRMVYANINADKINIAVNGDGLHLYLDDARITDKNERINHNEYESKVSVYRNAEVTAYVTYTQLKSLQVRGEQEVTVRGPLTSEKFKLKAYGEAEITLESVTTEKFKVVAYGENKIKISGKADHQRYRLYGENKIDSRRFEGITVSTTLYGEGRLSVNSTEEVHINAIGEPVVYVDGTSIINKGIVIGKVDIRNHN